MTLFRAPARHQKDDRSRALTGAAWAKRDSQAPRNGDHQTKAPAAERLVNNALMDCYNG